MKLMKLFAVLALFGMTNAAFAQFLVFNNKLNKTVYIATQERTKGTFFDSTNFAVTSIKPGDSYTSKGAVCLDKVALSYNPINPNWKGEGEGQRLGCITADTTFDIIESNGKPQAYRTK